MCAWNRRAQQRSPSPGCAQGRGRPAPHPDSGTPLSAVPRSPNCWASLDGPGSIQARRVAEACRDARRARGGGCTIRPPLPPPCVSYLSLASAVVRARRRRASTAAATLLSRMQPDLKRLKTATQVPRGGTPARRRGHMSKLRTRRPPCARAPPRGAVSAERRRLGSLHSPPSAVSKLRARDQPSAAALAPGAPPQSKRAALCQHRQSPTCEGR